MNKKQKEYLIAYGHLPNSNDELIEYIKDHFKINNDEYLESKKYLNSLSWKKLEIELFMEPESTDRARLSRKTNTFYVKGAKERKEIMKELITDYKIIYTITKFKVNTFHKTPTSFKGHEILLAEEGLYRPESNPDWDNLGKTYSDMVQGLLLINDNIIFLGSTEKFWSIKPRVQIIIEYLSDFDCKYNRNKIIKSKSFQKLINEERP